MGQIENLLRQGVSAEQLRKDIEEAQKKIEEEEKQAAIAAELEKKKSEKVSKAKANAAKALIDYYQAQELDLTKEEIANKVNEVLMGTDLAETPKTSKNTYTVNGKSVDKDTYMEARKKFDKQYNDLLKQFHRSFWF